MPDRGHLAGWREQALERAAVVEAHGSEETRARLAQRRYLPGGLGTIHQGIDIHAAELLAGLADVAERQQGLIEALSGRIEELEGRPAVSPERASE